MSIMVIENGQRKKSSQAPVQAAEKQLLGHRLHFLILQNTFTPNCSCFISGAIVPYVSATLQAPYGERKGLRIEAKQ